MQGSIVARLTNLLVIFFIVLLVCMMIILPFMKDTYLANTGIQAVHSNVLKLFLYVTAIPFMILLVMVKRLCQNVLLEQPFCNSSRKALNVISICAFIDFLCYAAGTVFIMKNLLSLTLMIAAFMIGLVSLILSQLVKMVSEIKQENELTI